MKARAVIVALFFCSAVVAFSQTSFTGIITDTQVFYDARNAGVVADGSTDDSQHLNTAISNAIAGKYGIVQLPCGQIKVNSPINLTNLASLTLQGCAANRSWGNDPAQGSSPFATNNTQIMCNTGGICLDTTGSSILTIRYLSLRIASAYNNPSKVAVLMGRDPNSCFSEHNRFENFYVTTDHSATVNNGLGYIGIYDLNAEIVTLINSQFIADTPVYATSVNDLNIASPFQTLQGSCPASMSGFTSINTWYDFQSNTGAGFVGSGVTEDFRFINGGWLAGGTPPVSANAIVLTGTGPHRNWYVQGQVEQLNCTAVNGAVLLTNTNLEHMDIDVGTAITTGGCPGYIDFGSNGLTISNSRIRVSVLSGTAQPLIQNAGATIIGGDLDITTTAGLCYANNCTGRTLTGTTVHSNLSGANFNTNPSSWYLVFAGDAAYLVGNLNVTGFVNKAGGSFKIDHPLDPANKYLQHSFVESPEMLNIYNGIVRLDEHGEATVQLPDYFEALNKDFRYQLTPIGAFAPVYLAGKIKGNSFRIAGGGAGMEVSWQVTGVRHDAYANSHRLRVEQEKPPAEKGHYLTNPTPPAGVVEGEKP